MKTAVVTGVSQGLGLVIADVLSKNGWQVVGTGRSERPAELASSIQYHQFDASDAKACTDFWQQLAKEVSDDTCLVNNAGSYVSGGLLDTKPEDYEKQMLGNYFTGVYMTRGLAEVVPRARIINIVSNSALAAHPSNSAYGAAKAAAMHFFQSLQKEFGADKYRITNLYPSDIASHGSNPDAIDPTDLATFVLQQANNQTSYYITDVTLYPAKGKKD